MVDTVAHNYQVRRWALPMRRTKTSIYLRFPIISTIPSYPPVNKTEELTTPFWCSGSNPVINEKSEFVYRDSYLTCMKGMAWYVLS